MTPSKSSPALPDNPHDDRALPVPKESTSNSSSLLYLKSCSSHAFHFTEICCMICFSHETLSLHGWSFHRFWCNERGIGKIWSFHIGGGDHHFLVFVQEFQMKWMSWKSWSRVGMRVILCTENNETRTQNMHKPCCWYNVGSSMDKIFWILGMIDIQMDRLY